jgi:predicted nucleic acid-binding protein
VRDARVDPDAGRDALSRWSRLEVHRYPAGGLLARIWALRDGVSAYDAAYVALAEALGCPLLTADSRLAAAPALRCEVQVVPR